MVKPGTMDRSGDRAPLRIGPGEAKDMVDAGKAIVLDVVASAVWPSLPVAIKGAIRIEPEQVAEHLDRLPRDRATIAYCT